MAEPAGLIVYQVRMKSRNVGEDESAKVVAAMRFLNQGVALGPTLLHCHHGADRTGALIAVYRMLYQSWTRADALAELIDGGYGFHPIWANIPRYIEEVDLADLKSRIDT